MDAQHRVNKRRRAWGYQIETMLTLESIREGVRPFEGESVSFGFRPRWRGSDPFSDRLLILLPSAIIVPDVTAGVSIHNQLNEAAKSACQTEPST